MELSLEHLYGQLTEIKNLIANQNQQIQRIPSNERLILLKLNAPQIKTYLTLDYEKEYTANDVASTTGNARAHESSILNQLTRLNLVERRKLGKTVYFKKRL